MIEIRRRTDIDGLRAVAVLPVLVFHAFPKLLPGGYLGVDIFFVISGFLITSIILESLANGRFSFLEFYARRTRRIFPALAVVLFSTYVIGWFTLFPDEYKRLGWHVFGGAGFVANLLLWSDQLSYFGGTSEKTPLLHLWSLGIEEQFYIVWPALLCGAWRRRFPIVAVLSMVALVSLGFAVRSFVLAESVSAFFSPLSRFWELASGGVLASLAQKRRTPGSETLSLSGVPSSKALLNFLSVVGALLLVVAFFFASGGLSSATPWTLVPVLGTSLILISSENCWFNQRVLSQRWLVWMGIISYPLYLWHWPLLALARVVEGDDLSAWTLFLILSGSLGLAAATYRFVERPIRLGWGQNYRKTAMLVVAMSLIGAAGILTWQRDGLPLRSVNQSATTYLENLPLRRGVSCDSIPHAHITSDWHCEIGNSDRPPRTFVFGDSHALMLFPALETYTREHDEKILFSTLSACPALLGVQVIRKDIDIEKFNCRALNERIFSYISASGSGIKKVLLAGRWTAYTAQVNKLPLRREDSENPDFTASRANFVLAVIETLSRFRSIGVEAIFVEDNPQQMVEPRQVLRLGLLTANIDKTINRQAISRQEHAQYQQYVNSVFREAGATTLNFDTAICDAIKCPLVRDSRFLYRDSNHLSEYGAQAVYPVVAKMLRSL